jgi:hypothetical protein
MRDVARLFPQFLLSKIFSLRVPPLCHYVRLKLGQGVFLCDSVDFYAVSELDTLLFLILKGKQDLIFKHVSGPV